MRKSDTKTPNYMGLDQRGTKRSDVYFRLSFDLPDGRQDIATCVNISNDGLLVRYPQAFELDDKLVFRLPILGARSAKVIWSIGGKSGTQFDDPIDEKDYLPLLRAMGVKVDTDSDTPSAS